MQQRRLCLAGTLGFFALYTNSLSARTLEVGLGQVHTGLTAALRAAEAGDVIRLAPGTYYECAVVQQDRLVIEGAGPDPAILSDTACEGKASLVIRARGVSVRNLTLARIRVPDGNGAGVRVEGADLLLEGMRFENNQTGVLGGGTFSGTLRVRNCIFVGSGVPDAERPTAALIVGALDRLEIENSIFEPGRGGAAILSEAGVTWIRGGQVLRPVAPRGATLQVSGGLVLEGVTMQAGPGPGGQAAAVLTLPGTSDMPLILRSNRLQGAGLLLLNWSGRDAELAGNLLDPGADEVSSAGAWGHRARSIVYEVYRNARHLAGATRRHVVELLNR